MLRKGTFQYFTQTKNLVYGLPGIVKHSHSSSYLVQRYQKKFSIFFLFVKTNAGTGKRSEAEYKVFLLLNTFYERGQTKLYAGV